VWPIHVASHCWSIRGRTLSTWRPPSRFAHAWPRHGQVISTSIDLYIESPDGLGGFTRYDEIPEIVRVAAPVYLKFGLRNAPNTYPSGVHLEQVAVQTTRARVAHARLGLDVLTRSLPDAVTPRRGPRG